MGTNCASLVADFFLFCYERDVLKEPSREKSLLNLHVMTEMHFLLQEKPKNIMHGRVKMYVMR